VNLTLPCSAALLSLSLSAAAQDVPEEETHPPAQTVVETQPAGGDWYSIHFQGTVATQYHPPFSAQYSGPNSLQPQAQDATSVVLDLFLGVRLWQGASLYLQPELTGGTGLSSTLGVASFPSGEVYRIGNPAPAVSVARLFLRQVIGLGGGVVETESDTDHFAGKRDRDTVTLTLGKVAIPDLVDKIPISNDPHTGFTSWGLWASAAYDYPADTHGYTWGLAFDLSIDWWSVRGGMFLEPTTANGMELEWNIALARGLVAEFEGRYTLFGLPGAARILLFLNNAHMGSYAQALEQPPPPNVTLTREYGRTKYGFAASVNQDFGQGLGAFLRLSYNDGRNETWAFTEMDQSLAFGAVQSGSRWGRPLDELGLGMVVSGLSSLHRQYLAAGGLGFILGDGGLKYALEILVETYYRLALTREISLAVVYQPIFNPAYNAARGPVQVFTGRFHVAF